MKSQSLQKIFAFIIALLMFFAMPQVSNAQKKGRSCPPCYRWYKGNCIPCRSCCTFISAPLPPNEAPSASLSEPSTINFPLSSKGPVSIKIYDMTGKLVKTVADKDMSDECHQLTLNTETIIPGIYFLRMETQGYTENKKIIVLK